MGLKKFKFIKLIFYLGMISFLSLSCASTKTAKKYKPLPPFTDEQKYIVAIMPFSYESELKEYTDIVNKIPSKLLSELYNTKRFRIIERSRMDALLKEMALTQIGILDEQQAVRIGKQLGAELILLGSVTSINMKETKRTIGIAYKNTIEVKVDIDARLIKLETGEIMGIAHATGIEIQEEKVALGAKKGTIESPETMINVAMDKALKDVAYTLASEISPKK